MSTVIIRKQDIDLKTDSTAREVIIYSDKAQVKRIKHAELHKGENDIVFSNLGHGIDEQSIKSSLPVKEAKIVSQTLEQNHLYFFKEDEHERIFSNILAALKKIIELFDTKSIYALENHYITDLRDYIQDLLNNIIIAQENSIPKLKEALDFLEKRMELNSGEILDLNDDLKTLKEEYSVLLLKLKKIREFDRKIQNNIRVTILSGTECSCDVEVSYILPNVSWRASYDAKLDTESKKMELYYYGEIKQNTGEEWENTKVILSTSLAENLVEIPAIFPVYVSGFAEKRKHELMIEKKVTRGLSEREETGADEEVTEEGGEGAVPESPETDRRIQAEKKGTSHTFTIEKPYTVPSDDEWHRLLIIRSMFDSGLCYETIPEDMEYIYLKATQKNTTTVPFLQGKVAVYRNESYMGISTLPYTAHEEEFPLSFGIDEDLRVKRIQYKNLRKPAKGPLGRHFREWEYHFILYNYKKEEKRVVLKEGIYVSELKEVNVKILDNTTPDYTLSKDGVIQWEVPISPDPFQHKKCILHYTLTAPKSFSLDGI
ncbi:MAG: mucoidy inhibitor MuiA family protein [Spirochaetales bacterium]|nr:mucoidy inhibitor MuiA family protein [Spirochaetales bacterium]